MEDNSLYINFAMGGKLGDFIQQMFAVKNICSASNKKANLYIYDRGWEHGLETVFNELYPIITKQLYINTFQKLENCELNNSNLQIKDLHDFTKSEYVFKNCWSEISSLRYGFRIEEYKWISYDKVDDFFKNKLLINRRYNPKNFNDLFQYDQLMNQFPNNTVFISTREEDYSNFPYKDKCEFYKINTIEEYFCSINSCALFAGNLSAPSSIANSLDVPRIIELPPNMPDKNHWVGEEKYSKNIGWFLSPTMFHSPFFKFY